MKSDQGCLPPWTHTGQHGCRVDIPSMLFWKSLYHSDSLGDVFVLRKALTIVGIPPVSSFCFSGEELPYLLCHLLDPNSSSKYRMAFQRKGSGDMGDAQLTEQ